MIKAKGNAGSWYAKPQGEDEKLPCVHRKWHNPEKGTYGYYLDPGVSVGEKIWDDFIAALNEKKRVILTEEDEKRRRESYIAIYDIDNICIDENGLRFDFIKRTNG